MASVPNLELLVGHPAGAALVQDYLAGTERASELFGGAFGTLTAFRGRAEGIDARFDREARRRAAEAIIVPEGASRERLDRFVEDGGYVVTTGQQPALFGGPLYGVHKALTAVRLAEALEAALDRPVLPLFWVASEDHDWAEANHADVVGVDNELHRVEVAAPDPDVHPALHRVRLGTALESSVDEFLQLLPETDFSAEYFALIRDAFQAGRTLPEGYHATLQHLLGRFGLYFTDAAHPALKRRSGEALLAELDRSEELEAVLRATASAVESAGYALQVPILEGGVNLFLEGPAGRERLYREDGAFRLRSSRARLSADEVRSRFEADPSVLSPNVLLRPVVESAVFPTLAYVGGPGEMAYFGQLRDYFEAHGVGMPVVFPRWAATPVEGKIRKVLAKFGMDVDGLLRPFHEIAGDIARDEMPEGVRSALGALKGSIASGVGELQKATAGIDPTLGGPVQHVRSQAFAALDDVERKIVLAIKREREIALGQLAKAQIHLYPHGQPVERVQSPFYFLTRYGSPLLDALHERFAVELT